MNYLVMRLFKGSLISTVFLFIFQLGYLVTGYVILSVETYDISWTMPHCVMTLRLIGLAMDVFDGKKKQVSQDLSAWHYVESVETIQLIRNLLTVSVYR